MRVTNFIIVLMLFVIGCSKKEDCAKNKHLDTLSSEYIKLQSVEGKEFCLPYDGLTTVTPFDYMHLEVGQSERKRILCGIVKLSNAEFNKIRENSETPIFEISYEISKFGLDSIMTSAMDSSGILKVQDLKGKVRGNVIAHAVSKGYSVHFDDYRGNYYWTKN
ncbi:hypothetical protein CLV98_101198 [Dyadobacter jejuensis]|uniref:Lipoprotein n=1 Tax=Dyadobacter jejuensis TaxID=1082580 RepID=A0A316AQL8_9BACT|nr:hypothetical protein [Dyadobacter jejuensis]PWJ60023.1 hypothetical protein CLV98_101198 [Dyadobacter jejuensis]